VDPVTLVVAALGAGLVAFGQATLTEGAKDAYTSLKSLVKNRFAGSSKHAEALAAFEGNPQSDTAAADLAAAVSESKAHEDPAIKEAAGKLLAEADPDGTVRGKYQVLIKGDVHGQVVGDHNVVTMNFDPPKPKS
jgi:hypothetical protein